jgi:hypothetical protein
MQSVGKVSPVYVVYMDHTDLRQLCDIAEASDDLLIRNPNHTDDAAWPDEQVEEEEEPDEMDADGAKRVTVANPEEEDMDDVEALMAGVKLDAPEEVGARTSR